MPVKVKFTPQKLKQKVKKAAITNLKHAGGSIRKEAVASIKTSKNPSPPGTPLHTRKGKLRRAIRFVVDRTKDSVVVGPRYSVVQKVGKLHEFGGKIKVRKDIKTKAEFPKRPFMGPVFQVVKPRLPRKWQGTIRR